MNPTPDITSAGDGGNFDPREAATLLEQTSRQARHQFAPAQPWLLAIRAVAVLAALGAIWLSVRGQQPYTGPRGSALWIVAAFVIINFTATVTVRMRATAGVRGRSRFTPAEIIVMVVSWAVPCAVMAALGDAKDSDAGYMLAVLLIVAGLAYATLKALRADWPTVGTGVAIVVTGAAAAAAGPVGAWAVAAVGLCVTLLGSAAVITWQLHRA
jgi:hypothetical protein